MSQIVFSSCPCSLIPTTCFGADESGACGFVIQPAHVDNVSLCLFKSNLNAQDKLGHIGLTGAYSVAASSPLLSTACGSCSRATIIYLVTAGSMVHTFYEYNPYRMPIDL